MRLKNIFLSLLVLCLSANIVFAVTYPKINSLLEKNNYVEADALIKSELNKGNTDNELLVMQAISLTMQNKLDRAQDVLDKIKKASLSNADYYYAQGAIYLKRIDSSDMRFRMKNDQLLKLAINQFNYSLKINPNNAKVYNALGVAELKMDELFKAQKYFEKALKVNPKYATALDNLGSVYYITNELDKAMVYYKKAAAINSSATVFYHIAQIELKKGDLNKALYYSNKSLEFSNNSTYAYNLIGEIYKKQGNEAAAIVSFKKSINIMPENPDPYVNLALIYETRGDVDAAIEELRTCYTLSPNSDVIKLNLADLTLSIGRYEDAIKYYSLLSDKLKNESVDGIVSAYYALATETANKSMFKSHRRLSDSMVYIDKAIKENPDNLELYITKSKLEKLMNNDTKSQDVLVRLISAPNNNISDYLAKGEALVELQQYRDARNLYTQVANMERDITSNLYLAEYFTFNKQYRVARVIINKILKEQPNNADALMNLRFIDKVSSLSDKNLNNAIYFKKHHDTFFQKEYLNKALKHNPNNVEANVMLADIYANEKQYKKASDCYKLALGELDNEKQIRNVTNKISKLDKKIKKDKSTENSNKKSNL